MQREHDVELVGAERGQHLARVAQRAHHEDASPVRIEVVEEHLGARRRRRRGLCAPSMIVSGCTPEHLEPTGHLDVGEALVDDLLLQRRGEERLDGGQRHGGVVALVGAVQRHETSV